VLQAQYTAHSTFFDGFGLPYGGCGVPMAKAKDDNGKSLPFIALNQNSIYSNGDNCGRWVEIKLGDNCVGGSNTKTSICVGGSVLLKHCCNGCKPCLLSGLFCAGACVQKLQRHFQAAGTCVSECACSEWYV
jgi:hypothetical protein